MRAMAYSQNQTELNNGWNEAANIWSGWGEKWLDFLKYFHSQWMTCQEECAGYSREVRLFPY
jgi:hypothetical protein